MRTDDAKAAVDGRDRSNLKSHETSLVANCIAPIARRQLPEFFFARYLVAGISKTPRRFGHSMVRRRRAVDEREQVDGRIGHRGEHNTEPQIVSETGWRHTCKESLANVARDWGTLFAGANDRSPRLHSRQVNRRYTVSIQPGGNTVRARIDPAP